MAKSGEVVKSGKKCGKVEKKLEKVVNSMKKWEKWGKVVKSGEKLKKWGKVEKVGKSWKKWRKVAKSWEK